MLNERLNRQELLVYSLLWTVMFLAPVLSQYISVAQDDNLSFRWTEVLFVWRKMAVFFVVFLVHNFLLLPLLVEKQRKWVYFSLSALLLALFIVVQCSQRPADIGGRPIAAFGDKHHPDKGHKPLDKDHRPPLWDGNEVPPDIDGDEIPPQWNGDEVPPGFHGASHANRNHGQVPPPHMEDKKNESPPPIILGERDLVALIILVLMLGMNIGVKLYFRHRKDHQRLAMLEKQNLEQQLQYLRYQINPHFLMNTLNNIHALVDIDAEKAKESIIGLSKIMRFVLYEGARQTVPLTSELAFTSQYVELMRMRVSQKVTINVDIPDDVPSGAQIPPLVLITFVENAFKHGVSYQHNSFIKIYAGTDDGKLLFTCSNSKSPKEQDSQGGVGLKNVRQRLDLIYGDRYSLSIKEDAETYNIKLTLPL